MGRNQVARDHTACARVIAAEHLRAEVSELRLTRIALLVERWEATIPKGGINSMLAELRATMGES